MDPNNPTYLVHIALAYQAQREYRPARLAFSPAIDLNPGYIHAYLLRGNLSLETQDYEEAVADALSALELNSDEGLAYQIIGDARLAQGDFADAVTVYSKAIDLGVRSPSVYESRGWAWHSRRYLLAAIHDYRQAIEMGSTDALVLYRLGFALLDIGRYEDSLEALLAAINQGIDTAEAHAILAVALDENSHREEADRSYQHALDLDARYGDPGFLAEQVLWSTGTVQRAKAILQRLGAK